MKQKGRPPAKAAGAGGAGQKSGSAPGAASRAGRRWLPVVALLLLGVAAVAVWWPRPAAPVAGPPPVERGAARPVAYVADEACVQCHEKAVSAWRGSHHDQAMMHASEASVRGDFANASFTRKGEKSRFFRRDGRFFVNTPGADGKPQDFEVKYTFGVDPLQQYLVEFPGGRLQALPLAWDTRQRRWFHLAGTTRHAADDPLHWTGRYQNWNLMCAECHSTNLRKGYDARTDTYDTRWDLLNVGCQSCHGPGGDHVAWAAGQQDGKAAPADGTARHGLVVDFRAGDARFEVDACGACHSRRQRLSDGDAPGAPYLDQHQPELLREGLYHADGQQLDEVYVYGSMLQSRMYQRGVRCTDCHDAHSLRLNAAGNAVCTQCHNAAGNPRFPTLRRSDYDTPAHHFHKGGGAAAQCVSCHMPSRNYMVVHARPDHSFRIPRPDQSARLGTPNACNQCHAERTPAWAAAAIAGWYGAGRRQETGFAGAFAAARAGRREAGPGLMAIIRDPEQPAIVRATAVDLLRDDGEAALGVLMQARDDREALVRAAAAQALADLPPERRIHALAPLLQDPLRLVRIQAARSLSTVPLASFSAAERQRFDVAFAEYLAAQAAMADMPATSLNLATLSSLRGEATAAQALYARTLEMDPFLVPARTAFAGHLSAAGDHAAAEAVLREGLRRTPGDGNLHYSLGLLLAESGQLAAAAGELGAAARLQPENARVAYNHGLALQQLGRRRDAETALTRACDLDPSEPAYAYALASLYLQKGRREAALRYAERLLAANPDSPEARQLVEHIGRGQPRNTGQNR